jgi:hypothetical protein|uniref:Uncharacterized protein n=1 Tax=viral metagenome TaxID=1070528 RepID=A0A6C0CI97_9ZZZZ
MANEWRAHVKKTMEEMKKSAPKGVTVMLKDVLKKAKTTYKKGTSEKHMVHHKKTAKKHHKKKHGKKHGKKSMKKRRRSGKK